MSAGRGEGPILVVSRDHQLPRGLTFEQANLTFPGAALNRIPLSQMQFSSDAQLRSYLQRKRIASRLPNFDLCVLPFLLTRFLGLSHEISLAWQEELLARQMAERNDHSFNGSCLVCSRREWRGGTDWQVAL